MLLNAAPENKELDLYMASSWLNLSTLKIKKFFFIINLE